MLNIQKKVTLAPFTTFNIGGSAKFFSIVKNKKDVFEALKLAKEKSLSVFVLGGGSNILVSDAGFDGLVVQVGICDLDVYEKENVVIVEAGAGLVWDAFVKKMVDSGYKGVECMSGIPGTVGAVPVQNVDAYGQEAKDVVYSVAAINIHTLEERNFSAEDCCFDYRMSVFKKSKEWIITHVIFQLTKTKEDLNSKREEILQTRKSKSTLYDVSDPNSISAGCFFVNPVISLELFQETSKIYSDIPSWPQNDGKIKVPAGWLVEHSGFSRGQVAGRAGISEKHALVLINRGNAKASDVYSLSEEIKKSVYNTFKIALEREPVLLGNF